VNVNVTEIASLSGADTCLCDTEHDSESSRRLRRIRRYNESRPIVPCEFYTLAAKRTRTLAEIRRVRLPDELGTKLATYSATACSESRSRRCSKKIGTSPGAPLGRTCRWDFGQLRRRNGSPSVPQPFRGGARAILAPCMLPRNPMVGPFTKRALPHKSHRRSTQKTASLRKCS
jgi:hypothetical protein